MFFNTYETVRESTLTIVEVSSIEEIGLSNNNNNNFILSPKNPITVQWTIHLKE